MSEHDDQAEGARTAFLDRIRLRCQWSGDDDHFMFLELRPGQAALANGFIHYLPEFDEV